MSPATLSRVHTSHPLARSACTRALLALAAIAPLSVAVAGETSGGPVADYDVTPRLLTRLPAEPFAAAITRDAQRFATGHNDGSILLARTSDGAPLRRLSGHRDTISGLSFSAAGDRLASSSYDGTIRLWSTDTGELISLLEPQA
jgi:WD40 repeat protein